MKFLSLFSGIEAASVAWKDLGWQCVGVSEIEPFPCAVLKKHYPNVPNLGDITKITKEMLNELGPIDIVVGGSPCQSYSVAGNKKGLDDPRGQLMFDYIRVVRDTKPKWFIWENVPGVLSSNNGKDFGSLLWEMEKLGYDLAWRVLDSKDFGVPQKRRRVFLVGHLGKGASPRKVLFESAGSSRHIEKSHQSREDNSTEIEDGVGTSSVFSLQGSLVGRVKGGPCGLGIRENGPMYTLTKTDVHCVGVVEQQSFRKSKRARNHDDYETWLEEDMVNTLNVFDSTNVRTTQCIVESQYYEHHPNDSRTKGPLDLANTVSARYGTGGGNTPVVVETMLDFNVASTLSARDWKGPNADWVNTTCQPKLVVETVLDKARTLCARDGKDGGPGEEGMYAIERSNKLRVRRLTPLECERLMGFPDGYTEIEWKGKSLENCPVSHRYKCLGNSMVTNVIKWLGVGIVGKS